MTTRDHLRAALIALHLLAITLAAIPTPVGRMTEANRRDPDVQETLRGWAPLGVALGVAPTEDGVVDWLWAAGQTIVGVRGTIMAPFAPYLELAGQDQAWRMFGTVNRRAAYLEVHALQDGAWVPLYVELLGPQWNATLLDQERVRAARSSWGRKRGKGGYSRFAAWLAARAATDHPRATTIRVRYQAVTIGTPAEVRAAGGLLRGDIYWEEHFDVGARP